MKKLCVVWFAALVPWGFSSVALAADSSPGLASNYSRATESPAELLVRAAASGDLGQVRKLVEGGTGLSVPEPRHRMTALHAAAANGQLRVLQWLVERKAEVNAQDESGYTPLLNACDAQHLAVARLLLLHGADPDVQPVFGPTPLVSAASQGDLQMLDLLLGSGAKVSLPDAHGVSPLQAAKRAGRLNVVQRLEELERRP